MKKSSCNADKNSLSISLFLTLYDEFNSIKYAATTTVKPPQTNLHKHFLKVHLYLGNTF